jgi:lysophospholipase L1-like esterase
MTKRPKVLLLGDSIRMSYQPLVTEMLKDAADVVGPDDNCGFTLWTLHSIERWLGDAGAPDVIHWNNGIHDSGHNPARSPAQIPLQTYATTIEYLLQTLQAAGAKVIWATSTPVHPDRPFYTDQWAWRNEEIDEYNAAALEIMNRYGVPVNDLHAVVAADCDTTLSEDQLHLSEAGMQKCAEAVTDAIRRAL